MARRPELILAAVMAAAGCAASSSPGRRATSASAPAGRLTSNVQRADYAGSASCEPCHADLYASFMRSPMHNMTRVAEGARIEAPFDGTEFHFKDDVARLETKDGKKYVKLRSKRGGDELFRVTRVIGGHYREDFAGARVDDYGAAPSGPDEIVLPVSFMLGTRTLRYKGYSVMVKERPGLRDGPVWNRTCVLCHNTSPYLTSMLGALGGKGVYQGEVVDPLLPPERRWTYAITDDAAASRAIEAEIERMGGRPSQRGSRALLDEAISNVRNRLGPSQLVEVGIGCESCHLGSRAHVDDPRVKPSLAPTAPFLRAGPGGRAPTQADAINHACARCHQVLFTGYEFTWEGGTRRGRPGGSNINSGEGHDMLLGDCWTQLTCTACHDPHEADSRARLARLDGPDGDAICTKCHAKYAAPEAARAHTHHDPAGAGGRCMNCHMPRKNMTLDSRLGRYHRVGSPTDPKKVLADRPLECALCHADKSVRQLTETMESWWKKSYDRDVLTKLYGTLDANVVDATLALGKPHEHAAALGAAGAAKRAASAPLVAKHLTHPYPAVRFFARSALEAIKGHACAFDLDADASTIEEAARRCLEN
jgi:predicted CXXCH cytochrome family protein